MSDFAERLRQERKRKGLTATALARRAGLSKQAALNLERPGADPKLSTVLRLAKALGVGPWELLPSWPGSSPVDQPAAGAGSTGVDAPAAEAGPSPVDLPRRVHTEKDDEELMRMLWSAIQDAYDAALDGDLNSAMDGLNYMLGDCVRLDDWPPLSVSYRWHHVWCDLRRTLYEIADTLENDVAKALARYGRVTDSTRRTINQVFRKLEKWFTIWADDWIDDWQEEREAEQAELQGPALRRPEPDEEDEDEEDE
jgi:transcriptional regulator with XRE-family HTH domain